MEIGWRIDQKLKHHGEKRSVMGKSIIDPKLYNLSYELQNSWGFAAEDLEGLTLGRSDLIFGEIDISKSSSHDSFFNHQKWPLIPSGDINYKQNDKMGDARVNWELNRHYHFQEQTKNYRITKDTKYLNELKTKFYKWVNENPFLMGISYTSEMELAIRALSWYLTIELLPQNSDSQQLVRDMLTGTVNLLQHVNLHQYRYSSANNHLIVEMAVLGIVGISIKCEEWVCKAQSIIEYEMQQQNFADGINKEQSIHYQTFVMEAVALFMARLKADKRHCSNSLIVLMKKMCEYTVDLMDKNHEVPHLGDNDEGKLFDVYGIKINHYEYVIGLCELVLDMKYLNESKKYDQNYFLFHNAHNNRSQTYVSNTSKMYKDGGHTILRGDAGGKEVMITFDHAELGFGNIAAHGHADALSFTLTIDGVPIFVDPGTYIYHSQIEWRDYFRKTINHNTITINSKDQSEMQGAFLWGKRATTSLVYYSFDEEKDSVTAEHDGYFPLIHLRTIDLHKSIDEAVQKKFVNIRISDLLKDVKDAIQYEMTFVLDENCSIERMEDCIFLQNGEIKLKLIFESQECEVEEMFISNNYYQKATTKVLKLRGHAKIDTELVTSIVIL